MGEWGPGLLRPREGVRSQPEAHTTSLSLRSPHYACPEVIKVSEGQAEGREERREPGRDERDGWSFSLPGGKVRWPPGGHVELWSHSLRPACGKVLLTSPAPFLEQSCLVEAQNIYFHPHLRGCFPNI